MMFYNMKTPWQITSESLVQLILVINTGLIWQIHSVMQADYLLA